MKLIDKFSKLKEAGSLGREECAKDILRNEISENIYQEKKQTILKRLERRYIRR